MIGKFIGWILMIGPHAWLWYLFAKDYPKIRSKKKREEELLFTAFVSAILLIAELGGALAF